MHYTTKTENWVGKYLILHPTFGPVGKLEGVWTIYIHPAPGEKSIQDNLFEVKKKEDAKQTNLFEKYL